MIARKVVSSERASLKLIVSQSFEAEVQQDAPWFLGFRNIIQKLLKLAQTKRIRMLNPYNSFDTAAILSNCCVELHDLLLNHSKYLYTIHSEFF